MEGPTPDPIRARAAVEAAATNASQGLRDLAEKFRAGTISAEDWDIAARKAVKSAILAGGMVAAGGRAHATAGDFSLIGHQAKTAFGTLERVYRDILAGKKIDGRFTAWAATLGRFAVGSYERVRRRRDQLAGLDEERRILGEGPIDHCDECIEQAALGWQPTGTLIPIGGCTCQLNCKCHIERRSSKGQAAPEPKPEPAEPAKSFETEAPAIKWAKSKGWKPKHKPTPSETQAVGIYKGGGFREVNGILRGKPPEDLTPERDEKFRQIIHELDKVFADSEAPEAFIAHRGLKLDRMGLAPGDFKPGTLIHDQGFVSTSLLATSAWFFTNPNAQSLMLKITVPKGTKAVSIPKTTGDTGEVEITLNRGTTIRVTGEPVQGEDGVWTVDAEVVE